jgi:cell division protein FtsI/penicillin-binding protein 2
MNSWRQNLVFILIILFAAVILCRLIYIQILNHQYWQALAQGQQKFFESHQGERGEIFLQRGIPLAVNRNFDFVYLSPAEIKKPEETAEVLSLILNLNKDFILEKIRKDSYYELIKNNLTEKELENLKKLNLPGIYLGRELGRYYPLQSLASQVIGFLGGDGKGQYGIEGYYDEILQGKERFLEKEKGPGGFLINGFLDPGEKGADLVLTIDYNIQFLAEKLLEEAYENLDIESGQIIVMDPNSGKILALANFPNFDPNQYSKVENLEIFQNGAIQKFFEPGSVFKPITMAAALEKGAITPQTTYIDEGKVKIGGYTIYNYDGKIWGKRTMTEVLEKSINTGAVFVEKQIGHDIFKDYIKSFGIFEPTGIDLQGEVFSENKEFKKGYEVNFATASFGQGIEMTPIQLARAYCVIANKGKLVRPYLVEKIIENEKTTEIHPQIASDNIISQKTASQLTAMLVSVVENGFAKAAKIPGYYIAGKTGTAQMSLSALGLGKRGYSNKTWQTFIGFAPAFNPQFLVLVKLDDPKARDASVSAVPIFRELAKYIIDLWQIPPDYELR